MSGSPISPQLTPGAAVLGSAEPVLSVDERERLIRSATAARGHAYAPYSRFQVGAALLAADGRTFAGCNVENVSYSMTLCAERVAAATAIAAGCRDWRAIAIASPGGVTPCGACRQFLAEFSAGLIVITVNVLDGSLGQYRLAELLPHAFGRPSLPVATPNDLGEPAAS